MIQSRKYFFKFENKMLAKKFVNAIQQSQLTVWRRHKNTHAQSTVNIQVYNKTKTEIFSFIFIVFFKQLVKG